MRHLGVGWAYREQNVKLFMLDDEVISRTDDAAFIGETRFDAERDYQPKGDGFQKRPAQVQSFTVT